MSMRVCHSEKGKSRRFCPFERSILENWFYQTRIKSQGITSSSRRGSLRISGMCLDLCLFVPCFPAFFDLLISLGQ